MEKLEYSDEQKNALFEAIYLGVITLTTLPKNLYNETAKVLRESLYKGYGGTLLDFEFGTPDYELLKELRENIYIFSGAKTATQVTDIKSLMYDGDKVLNYPEFKKLALQKFDTYNENYLESEYITAHTSAGSAKEYQFTQDNKALFPRLRSVAILDQYTQPECRRMDGVIANVDDPIWNHNLAPRHWRCRCHEERLDKYDKDQNTPKATLRVIQKENDAVMQDVFKMNPAKEKVIFNEDHNYFDIGKKHPELAKNNFNLKIPKTDERKNSN